jgi:hypothetical protein
MDLDRYTKKGKQIKTTTLDKPPKVLFFILSEFELDEINPSTLKGIYVVGNIFS